MINEIFPPGQGYDCDDLKEMKISSTKAHEEAPRPAKNGFHLRDPSCGFVDDFPREVE
jgi:hypothetical protein